MSVPFEDFVRARSAALFRTALLLTGQHRAEAEDLLQGALERAYRHWGRVCRAGDPERYVRRILANAAIDRLAAGPLWFVGLRQATAAFEGHSTLGVSDLIVIIRDGATAWVSVVGPAAGHFRFLFGPNDFQYGGIGRPYALADGENGVTFAGCPPISAGSGNLSDVPGYTEFFGRYLIDKIPTPVSLDISTPASRRPTRITFMVGY